MIHHLSIIIFILALVGWQGCSSRIIPLKESRISHVLPKDLEDQIEGQTFSELSHWEPKTIRTYFHFFNDLDSSINFDGDGARNVVQELLQAANQRLRENDKMNLPLGNTTPVLNSNIQLILGEYQGRPGIFHHYRQDPEVFIKKGNRANRYDRKVIARYAIRQDSVINIFMLPYDPKQLKSGEQSLEGTAIALGTTIKLPGVYQSERPPWTYAGLLNHELGHILGLRHTWNLNDGCGDTPKNPNCWNQSAAPPCDRMYSNNLMDYNAHQSAITPCQIAKMHANISNPGHVASRVVESGHCHVDKQNTVVVNDNKIISVPSSFSGDLVIHSGGVLWIRSLVHFARDAGVIIKKGGILVLEDATLYHYCGFRWNGISIHPKGKIYFRNSNILIRDVADHRSSAVN